jgi:hypothetical protein
MLKRVLSVGIALLATIVAVVIYWLVFMPWFPFPTRAYPWIKLILALIAFAMSIYFFLRWRSCSALLLLVGSIPVLLVNISFIGWIWRMDQYYSKSPSVDDPWLALLFPGDNEPSSINTILHDLVYVSMLCLPVAFFLFLFRLTDWRLPKANARSG